MSSGFKARHDNHKVMMPGRAQLEITVHIEETVRVLLFISYFVARVNCVHHLISPDLHVNIFLVLR